MKARLWPARAFRKGSGLVLGLSLGLLGATGTTAASTLFDGSAARAWAIQADGSSRSYNAPDWLETVPSGLPGSHAVLINQTAYSQPPMSPALPSVSLIGLSAGTTISSDTQTPAVSVSPTSGEFDQTTRLRFQVTPGSGSGNLALHWKITNILDSPANPIQENKTFADKNGSQQHDIFLMANGEYTLEYWAVQDSKISASRTAGPYLLNLSDSDPLRDTDGDGIPDAWEIANGMDPLTSDLSLDSDGDGWSDFDEILRGSDPNDPDSVPLDSDGDGWSDFDEDIRGTDPHNQWDRPRARSLSEVEYLISGGAFIDSAATQAQTLLTELEAYDIDWQPLYRQRTLEDERQAMDTPPPHVNSLPEYLRPTPVSNKLGRGALPALRLPAGQPVIMRTGHFRSNQSSSQDAWTAKIWLHSCPDIAPSGVSGWLAEEERTWETAEEWQEAYVDYLRAHLVQDLDVQMTPTTTIDVALIETVIAWLADISGNDLVLLGSDRGRQARSAVTQLRQLLADADRDFNALYAELIELTKTRPEMSALRDRLLTFYDNTSSISAPKVTHQIARALVDSSDSERYPLALLAIRSLASILELDETQLAALLDPAADFDGDNLQNAAELLIPGSAFTRPDKADSDGDGLTDDIDPCPNDPGNNCLLLGHQNQDITIDTDGDGVPDVFDNCPNTSNPDQADTDGYAQDGKPDGIGDACASTLLAAIIQPGANLTLTVGSRLTFAALPTETAAGAADSLLYQWNFDGPSALSHVGRGPVTVLFNEIGTHEVTLTVSGAGLTSSTDTRTITVIDSLAPLPALPTLTATGGTVDEGNAGERTGLFYLSLSHAAAHPVSVDYQLQDAGATAGEDYKADSGTIEFAAGQRQALLSVTIYGDTVHEPNEDIALRLSNPIGARLTGDIAARLTIIDDDPLPRVGIFLKEPTGGYESEVRGFEGERVEVLVGLADSNNNPTSSTLPVTVNLSLGGSAELGTDYEVEPSSESITIEPGQSFAFLYLHLLHDDLIEADETIVIELTSVDNAEFSAYTQATLTVLDLPPLPQNDTGVDFCNDRVQLISGCLHTSLVQDGETGRDVDHPDDEDGRLGFSFIKLDESGQHLTPDSSSWACVLDTVTGLVWQAVNDEYLAEQTFSWYEPDPARNGGIIGHPDTGTCSETDTGHCNTHDYAGYHNTQGLCGFHDWRLPRVHELFSLMDLGEAPIEDHRVAIDVQYFPHHAGGVSNASYWTADSHPQDPRSAYHLSFGAVPGFDNVLGSLSRSSKDIPLRVILVRSGEE